MACTLLVDVITSIQRERKTQGYSTHCLRARHNTSYGALSAVVDQVASCVSSCNVSLPIVPVAVTSSASSVVTLDR
jgi:hypothetical protein